MSKSFTSRLVDVQKNEGIYKVTHDVKLLVISRTILDMVALRANNQSRLWHVILHFIDISEKILFNID